MLKRLISKILHRYIGLSDPISPSNADHQSSIVTPVKRQPRWADLPPSNSRSSTDQSSATVRNRVDRQAEPGPNYHNQNEKQRKRTKVFDTTFS